MHHYFEFGGGLGDVFMRMFEGNCCSVLDSLRPEDRATVVLITHNPYVRELFDYHPKAGQIDIKDLGYWSEDQSAEMRAKHGLPRSSPVSPAGEGPRRFYPAPADEPTLERLEQQDYVVFSVSAGLTERDLPEDLILNLIGQTQARGLLPVFVGRSYERLDRQEYRPLDPAVFNAIDRLTVPGAASAVKSARGVICCHSAINILAWLLRKPQLLLYPACVKASHIAQRDRWAFGVDFPECRHAQFDTPVVETAAKEFFDLIAPVTSRRAPRPDCSLTRAKVRTLPFPAECSALPIDENLARLTSAPEVKFLCWLAQRVPGNIVEIGCNQGLTTRDLAALNPDKVVYAVDYFGMDHTVAPEQQDERPDPRDICCRARASTNVVCLHQHPARLNYEALRDVGLIIIDGDHTAAGVRAETEPALSFLLAQGRGVLVWHDYYETAPNWVAVKAYVNSLGLEIEEVEGTWLALARIDVPLNGIPSIPLKPFLALPDFVRKAIAEAEPMAQNTSADNLGFGWVYYALVRNLRPKYVVAIGSARGFMPFCAARAVQENGLGQVLFIDPSYSGNGHPGWGGRGLWSDSREVAARIAQFGLAGWISHYKMTSQDAFPQIQQLVGESGLGLLIIDGAHTYEQSLQDFERYSSLMDGGFAIFHDSTSGDCEVSRTISTLRRRGYSTVTFHHEVGLTLVEISRPASVQKTWTHLCSESNRARLLLPHAKRILRAGDSVFDAYCGSAPLAPLLDDVAIFGFDADPQMIELLRQRHPKHRWEQLDERAVPFAELPEHVDVLLGLGLNKGHASWDAQNVVNNVRYLLGRYFPRACLFESQVGYHNADILDELHEVLSRLGYLCRSEQIETDLAEFSVRKLLVAEKPQP